MKRNTRSKRSQRRGLSPCSKLARDQGSMEAPMAAASSSSPSCLMVVKEEQQQVVQLVSAAEAEKILCKFRDIPASPSPSPSSGGKLRHEQPPPRRRSRMNSTNCQDRQTCRKKARKSSSKDDDGDGGAGGKAQKNSLVFSCFRIDSGSCRHLDMVHEPMLLRVRSSSQNQLQCTASSSDALVPLIDLPSSDRSSSSPCLALRSSHLSKSALTSHRRIHLRSVAEKVQSKLSRAASNCLAHHRYRMRLLVATRRYRLKATEA